MYDREKIVKNIARIDGRSRPDAEACRLEWQWCMHQKVKKWNIEELPETMALSQHYALRQRRPPSAGNLSALPAPITWDYGFAPPRPPLMKAYALPQWREGYGNDPKRIPAWWANRKVEVAKPLELTPEQKASVAGVIGQIKMKLAQNLNRMIDTFREFDEDQSGKIDKREFQLALRKLGIVAHKSAFDNTFDTFDDDRSGTLEYHELNNKLRRRVDDPSHTSAMGGGRGAATSSRAAWAQPAEELAEAVPSLPYTGPPIRAPSAPSVHPNPYAGAFGARRYEHFEPPMQMIKLPSGLCVPREVYDDVLRSAQQRYNHNGKHVY